MNPTWEEWLASVDRVTKLTVNLRDEGAEEMADTVLNWTVKELVGHTFLGNLGSAQYTFVADLFTVKLDVGFRRSDGQKGTEA